MDSSGAKKLLYTVLAILLQVLLLNRINLFGYATPCFLVYLVLITDTKTNPAVKMIWAFASGLIVDIFSNTLGMQAAAMTLVAFIQPTLVRLYVTFDKRVSFIPGKESMNTRHYYLYLVTGILVHHIFYFILKTFSFSSWKALLLEILVSALLTFATILLFELLFKPSQPKRRKFKRRKR